MDIVLLASTLVKGLVLEMAAVGGGGGPTVPVS